MKHEPPVLRSTSAPGFTAMELLTVLALGAVILGSIVVGYGTLVRMRTGVAALVTVQLGAARTAAFALHGATGTSRNVVTAPSYGMMAQAEELRETFLSDTLGATAVFCLPRAGVNTYKPHTISYNPVQHGELDTPQKFREHLYQILGRPATFPYRDYRNPLNTADTAPSENASIFVLGFSRVENKLKVLALYDIDVIRFTVSTEPQGFYVSVKRYSDNPLGTTQPLAFSGGYEIFYPPSLPEPDRLRPEQWASDGFTPLFITFERATRLAWAESTEIDRFKKAAERPFYFIWWPDPGARNLSRSTSSLPSRDPRHAYNHMGGSTSFMFTVPMFPTL